MSKTFGYGRVSTAHQFISPEVQRQTCQKYYDVHLAEKSTWGDWYADDDVSARLNPFPTRPAAHALLDRAERGDHIIVAKLDRAFRSVKDWANTMALLENLGINFHLVDMHVDTSTPIGKFIAGIIAGVGEFEGALISQRITEVFAYLKSQGWYLGKEAPFGMKHVKKGTRPTHKKLVIDHESQKVIGEVLALKKQGVEHTAVAVIMASLGRPSPRGKWTLATIKTIMRNVQHSEKWRNYRTELATPERQLIHIPSSGPVLIELYDQSIARKRELAYLLPSRYRRWVSEDEAEALVNKKVDWPYQWRRVPLMPAELMGCD